MDRLTGLVLAVGLFVLYVATLSGGAYPGESASLIVQRTGLFPRLTPNYPLWNGLAWLVTQVPMGDVVTRLNVLSSLLAALSVWLLHAVLSTTVYALVIHETEAEERRARMAARLAAVGGALAFGLCVPFWVIATRAHVGPMGLFLLLLSAALLVGYVTTARWRWALALVVVYGLGLVEFATLIVFAPLFAAAVLAALWAHEQLTAGRVVQLVLGGLLGLLLYLVAAWSFVGTEGYGLREYRNFWQIIWFMWRDQYALIAHSLPQKGWLIVLFVTIVPWLAALAVARRALNEENDWSFYLLHLILTPVAAAVLLNLPLAPWPMLGFGQILVTPYLLVAILFGYLLAYWYIIAAPTNPEAPVLVRWLRRGFCTIVVLAGLALLPLCAWRNLPAADGRSARLVNGYAREIVECMDGRRWLVTDGILDHHLALAAREMGRDVRLLNLAARNNRILLRHIGSQFEDNRMRMLAQIGVLPLLQEWFETDPQVEQSVAVLSTPDLWIGAGFTMVPNRLVFLGARKLDPAAGAGILAAHEAFWASLEPKLREPLKKDDPLRGFQQFALRHAGLVANNLGFFLEDLQKPEDAFRAYESARRLDPDNLSALLNMSTMVENGFATPRAEEVQAEIERLKADPKARYPIGSLARYCGYVRAPEAFASLGWGWARSGLPGMAVTGLKKAMDLLPEDKRSGLKQSLADLYLMQEKDVESEVLYYELLVENPENQRALLGMARVSMRKGDFAAARSALEKAEQAGVPESLMRLEWAAFYTSQGDAAKARTLIEDVIKEKPELPRAWAMLISVLVQQGDQSALADSLRRLQQIEGEEGIVGTIGRGYLALMENDLSRASRSFTQALRLRPNDTELLEMLLRLDVLQRHQQEARVHAQRLLQLDPSNAYGNRVMGSLHLEEREFGLAEASFRKSLERKRNPETLNDLAWLLQESGLYPEAEKNVRESLQLDSGNAHAWDTLGVVLMKTGRFADAEATLRRAVELSRENPSVLLHLLELQVAMRDREAARATLEKLSDNTGLSQAEQSKLSELRSALSAKPAGSG